MPSLLEELKQELERWTTSDVFCGEECKLSALREEMENAKEVYLMLQHDYDAAVRRIDDIKAVIAFLEER